MTSAKMAGHWGPWYGSPDAAGRNYGPVGTYHLAEQFLAGLDIEDWGCGFGYFRTIHTGGYIGVDGTEGYCDVLADLTEYTSRTDGILCRHVLDHNPEWRLILANLLASFTVRAVLILFTPSGQGERIGYVPVLDVHDFALPHDEISATITDAGCTFERTELLSNAGYGFETVWTISR